MIQTVRPKVLQVPATLEGLSMLKDGGISIRLHTKELTAEEKVDASKFYQQYGWFTFSANDDVELPVKDAPLDEFAKSPSQRLRNTIFVLYQQSGPMDITFDEFYRRKMEQFISAVKSNLRD